MYAADISGTTVIFHSDVSPVSQSKNMEYVYCRVYVIKNLLKRK